MILKVSIKQSGNKLDMNKVFNQNNMYKIGKMVRLLMIKRTKSGKDYLLKSFIPYAKSNKDKYGKTVDLTQSGQMLNSINIKAYKGRVNIYIQNAFAIKKAMWNLIRKNYQRKFFGISNPIQLKINKMLDLFYKRVYK